MSLIELIKADLFRNYGKVSFSTFLNGILTNRSFTYCFWLRLSRSNNNIIRFVGKVKHKSKSKKYNIQIPSQTKIGAGFYMGHHMCVVIHPSTIIGQNCNISQFVTIGSNHGQAAEIGDNVYIGPNVNIVENVKIGNNVTIGAGAVVVKDIPDNATVAGVPAKIISFNEPARYINNRWFFFESNQI